ncbi:MAG: transpeptidase family protein [Thermotogaceae bacterium]|nr:transpeptidase family protein [Thermotogaceae bacterium]
MDSKTWQLRVKFIVFLMVVASAFMLGYFAISPYSVAAPKLWSVRIPGLRGEIRDATGRLCAADRIFYVAYLDVGYLRKTYSPRLNPYLKLLFENFNLDLSTEDVLRGDKSFLRLGRSSTRDDLLNLVPTEMLFCVSIETEVERKCTDVYGMEKILGRVIDGNGIGGIEQALDEYLRPRKEGRIQLKYHYGLFNANSKIESIQPPQNGNNLRLTLDIDIQRICYEEIQRAVEENNALAGGIIVVETKTGKVRALSFTRKWNDTVLGYIEPGSAIKPIVYAIALENNVITPESTFLCQGSIKPVDTVDITIGDMSAHGVLNTQEALVHSCNVATVMIAQRIHKAMGDQEYWSWLKKFGFGQRTGIQIAGEIEGVLRRPQDWSKIDFAMLSIGHGIGVTPIQFVSAFNVIANDGCYVYPTLLETDKSTEVRIISSENARVIREALRRVVTKGTGTKASLPNIKVAGKTGTAQKLASGPGKYYSIFVGFFPYEDPEYTVLIYVDEASSEKYLGGDVAAPVFAKVVERITSLSVKEPLTFTEGVMPDLRGLTLRDALIVLKMMGVNEVQINGTGIIREQYPEPGSMQLDRIELSLE